MSASFEKIRLVFIRKVESADLQRIVMTVDGSSDAEFAA